MTVNIRSASTYSTVSLIKIDKVNYLHAKEKYMKMYIGYESVVCSLLHSWTAIKL